MAIVTMTVKLVHGSGVDPFTENAQFSLDEETHEITIGGKGYSPVEGKKVGASAVRHYKIGATRHGIGITGSGSALRVVGVVPVDPTSGEIQATGMWVAEPPKP
jgi:hypothetical protein